MPTVRRFHNVNAAVRAGLIPHHYREVPPAEVLSNRKLNLVWCGKKAFEKYSPEEIETIEWNLAIDRSVRHCLQKQYKLAADDPRRVELQAEIDALNLQRKTAIGNGTIIQAVGASGEPHAPVDVQIVDEIEPEFKIESQFPDPDKDSFTVYKGHAVGRTEMNVEGTATGRLSAAVEHYSNRVASGEIISNANTPEGGAELENLDAHAEEQRSNNLNGDYPPPEASEKS